MKKIILICLSFILVLSLVACGNDVSPKNDKDSISQEEGEPSGEVPIEEDKNTVEIVGGAAAGIVEGALNGISNESTIIETVVESIVEGVTSVIESQTIESVESNTEEISESENDIEEGIIYFNAYVLEVGENDLLVEPFEDSSEFSNSDKIYVHLTNDYKGEDIETFGVGDILEVVYNGVILESYPAQIYASEIYVVGSLENEEILNDENIGPGQISDFIWENETIVVKKPVIYLYPEKPINVNVEVLFDGDFVFTYPLASNGRWDVYAYPNGTLINNRDGREHPYIFWEGTSNINWDLSKGFVVKGEDTLEFLEEKLEFLGLNDREISEFITYWVPLMQDNEYNLITFQDELYTNNFALNVYPKPDSTLRVFMVYKALDEPINIQEPILKSFDRTGFTVIEWGGAEVK